MTMMMIALDGGQWVVKKERERSVTLFSWVRIIWINIYTYIYIVHRVPEGPAECP